MHNLQISTYKNNSHSTRTTLKCRRSLQPYFKSRKGINQTSLCHVQPTRFAVNFFSYNSLNTRKQRNYYQRATYKDNFSTPPQPRILFWFTSSGFLKRPISFEVLAPTSLFLQGSHIQKESTGKGLPYAAKAVPAKDYFTHMTLTIARKGC